MKNLMIMETVEYIKSRLKNFLPVETAIILGSGLGDFAAKADDSQYIKYGDIPHFTASTVKGHEGVLVAGRILGRNVLLMKGRTHFYEGYGMDRVIYPVRVMRELGVKTLLVTNSCGGINEDFRPGDLMVINDHINLTGTNPLIGENDTDIGERFPDMTYAYDPELIKLIHESGEKLGIELKNGVYASMTGPSYETKAEIRFLRIIGADAVGMSTVPEVIAANHAGIKTAGISCITNMAAGMENKPLNHEEVVETARLVKDKFERLVYDFLGSLK